MVSRSVYLFHFTSLPFGVDYPFGKLSGRGEKALLPTSWEFYSVTALATNIPRSYWLVASLGWLLIILVVIGSVAPSNNVACLTKTRHEWCVFESYAQIVERSAVDE